jgi:hypothetical protein
LSSFLFDAQQANAKGATAVPEVQKLPEPIFWVKCDECDRWRIINGLTHEEQCKLMKKSWFCKMHPDVAQRECDKVVAVSAAVLACLFVVVSLEGVARSSEVGTNWRRRLLQTALFCK